MDEDNIITLNDENGNEVEFEFLDLIGKWVIVHRLLKVDGVENLDGVAMLQKGVAALNHDAAFSVCLSRT